MRGFIECLQRNPEYVKTPNNPEKRSTVIATKHPKRQGRVGASDKDKNNAMLDHPETALGFSYW
jgi:hypothetical protein